MLEGIQGRGFNGVNETKLETSCCKASPASVERSWNRLGSISMLEDAAASLGWRSCVSFETGLLCTVCAVCAVCAEIDLDGDDCGNCAGGGGS